jgi:hypothetical protein
MVLSKQNSGIYLTKEWHDTDRERQRCLYDSRDFSDVEKAFYGVTDTGIKDGLEYQLDDAMKHDNMPLDTRTTPKTVDERDKPEV